MSEKRWTEEQLSAIETRDRTLLVSAAAGSGKTATLTERVIRQITDPQSPIDLSSMLIVTFMKTAAKEVRDRVGAAIRKAAAEHPEDDRLERQLLMIGSAQIQTIDSFCASLLRRAGDAVGIPPNFRVLETAEAKLLAYGILNDLITAVYDGLYPDVASPEEIDELADSLSAAKRDGDFVEALLELYEKTGGQVEGVRAIRRLVGEYDPEKFVSASRTGCGGYIFGSLQSFFAYAEGEYEYALRLLDTDGSDPNSAKLSAFLIGERAKLRALSAIGNLDDLCRAIPEIAPFGERVPSKNKNSTAAFLEAQAIRTAVKEAFAKTYAPFCLWNTDEWRAHYTAAFRLGTTLANLLEKFDSLYDAEKRRIGAFTFSDVEHYAYACLYDENGGRTAVAESVAAGLSAVYIDEYQDVNELQDRIFAAVSGECNRFMVGDIKQCICWFRGSEPDIFAGMKNSFAPLGEAKEGDLAPASVFMSKNFRSDAPILDFVNSIFEKGYTKGDSLVPGTDGQKEGGAFPEIHILSSLKESPDGESPEDGEDEAEELTAREAEAEAIARKVGELLRSGTKKDGSPIEPGDIAILIRAANMEKPLSDRLGAAGIPCETADDADFFLNADVLLALSLLTAIDNPHRDIYLASLLCSPLFTFSADDLVALERPKYPSLYAALVACAEKGSPLSDRAREFFSRMDRYRRMADEMRVDLFISRVFRESGLFALAAKKDEKDGRCGRENLLLLQHYAKVYESNDNHGLSGFLGYLHRVIEDGTRIGEKKKDHSGREEVHIMTIHSSKGLEYSVCILADAGRKISDLDSRKRIVYDPGFGISMRERAPGGLALLESAAHRAVLSHHAAKNYEEDLRVLYVALTRPREKLYLYGTVKKDARAYAEQIRESRTRLSEHRAKHMASYLEIALLADPSLYRLVIEDESEQETASRPTQIPGAARDPSPEKETFEKSGEKIAPAEEVIYETIRSRFAYRYPDPSLTEVPRKLSVSYLSPTVLDGSEEEKQSIPLEIFQPSGEEIPENVNKYLKYTDIQPRFYAENHQEESAKKGIATHTFLQFFDPERMAEDGAEEELLRLSREGYLQGEDVLRVRMDEIGKFAVSRLFAQMRGAKKLWREFRFHVELPAEKFSLDPGLRPTLAGKQILVQGVMDCILEEEDGSLRLIDYKTDRLPGYALRDRTAAAKILAKKHSLQLSYYALAVEKIFGRRPSSVEVYSLPLGDTVPIPLIDGLFSEN